MKKLIALIVLLVLAGGGYLGFWPVPIEPVAWKAPLTEGYVGVFTPNTKLDEVKRIDLGEYTGPEGIIVGPDKAIYAAMHDGVVLRYDPVTGSHEVYARNEGRALGIQFGPDNLLYVADAYRGLLRVEADRSITVLADETDDGNPIPYADGIDVASNGNVYFSDASLKFGAKANGGTLPASLLDLMEHGPNGRIIRFDAETGKATTIASGLSFPNGVALTEDEKSLLIVETGTYSVLKLDLETDGEPKSLISNLPGFPDNINRNEDGSFWVGLVSPRNNAMDKVSDKPFLRKMIQRLPAFMRPKPERYGFILRINKNGEILETMHGPSGNYALTTGAIDGPDDKVYISSLTEPDLAVYGK